MSNTTSKPTKASTLGHVQALIAGTKQHFPSSTITLGNTAYTTASLVELLQSLADAIAATDTVHAASKEAVSALRASRAKVSPVMAAYKRWILTTFGNAAQTLVDFGVQAPKARTPLTTGKLAAAAAKAASTRKARGTVGSKKKLAVKGDVTGVIVTPVTTVVAPTPSATPAEATSNAHAPTGAPK
jgi:hypothetical protein